MPACKKRAVMYIFEPFKREGGLLTPFPNTPTCRCPTGGIDCKDWGPAVLKREGGRERVLSSLLHGLKWVLEHFANSGFNWVLRRRGEKPLKAFLFIAGYLGDSTWFCLSRLFITCFLSLRKQRFTSYVVNDTKGTQKSVDDSSAFVVNRSI